MHEDTSFPRSHSIAKPKELPTDLEASEDISPFRMTEKRQNHRWLVKQLFLIHPGEKNLEVKS